MAFDWEKYGISNPKTYGDHANLNASHNADLIYQNIVGRNMDPGGRKYWTDQIANLGTKGYQDMVNSLLASPEYKDRATAIAANPNITEHELDRLSSAYVSPYHSFSGSAVAGWTPGDPLTMAMAKAITTDTTDNAHANYGDVTNKTVADIIGDAASTNKTLGGPFGVTGGIDTKVATNLDTGQWDKLHDTDPTILGSGAVDFAKTLGTTNTHTIGETLTNTGAGAGVIKEILPNGNLVLDVSNITGGENNDTITGGENNDTITGGENNDTITGGENNDSVIIDKVTGEIVAAGGSDGSTNLPAGLTMDDLNAWWAGIDKSAFTGSESESGSMDQFMQLMMFMAMMRPQGGGGYGGGIHGYGGLNPGGVQSAYNPMANLQSYMDAFKTLPGISTNTINTGTTT